MLVPSLNGAMTMNDIGKSPIAENIELIHYLTFLREQLAITFAIPAKYLYGNGKSCQKGAYDHHTWEAGSEICKCGEFKWVDGDGNEPIKVE